MSAQSALLLAARTALETPGDTIPVVDLRPNVVSVLAYEGISDVAAFWMCSTDSVGVAHDYHVVLRCGRGGHWALAPNSHGSLWLAPPTPRAKVAWEGWGPVFNLAFHAFAEPQDDLEHPPPEGWSWVTGVASQAIDRITVCSSLQRATRQVEPHTGFFLVLLRAKWLEPLEVRGLTADGSVLPLHG